MIRTHGRYPYSNITKRPVYDWPNGTRLAVYVAVNIEQFSFGEGKGAAIAPADQANSHSVYSWRDLRATESASGACWSCSTPSRCPSKPR